MSSIKGNHFLLSEIQCLFLFDSMAAFSFLTELIRRKRGGKRKGRVRRGFLYSCRISIGAAGGLVSGSCKGRFLLTEFMVS